MSLMNILAGLVLVAAMGAGCTVWATSENFVTGAIVFIVGALIAGALKNDKKK